MSNFLKAMDDAAGDDLDLINISAGIHHDDCGGRCRPCMAAQAVVQGGTTVIAGAGNDLDSNEKSVFCPAYADEVIGVGAFHTYCGYAVQPHRAEFPFRRNPVQLPPNCYFLEEPDSNALAELYGEQMCSQMGCSDFDSCEEYRDEQLWHGNVDLSLTRPDVFAPSHIAHRDGNGRLRYQEGSSFSTAYVTGSLAGIFGSLDARAHSPTPSEVRSAITMITETVGETSWRKFDAATVQEFLSRE